jgi:hypothetical protein
MDNDNIEESKNNKEQNKKDVSEEILPDFRNLEIGDDIKLEASIMFKKFVSKVKKDNRKNILFSIVYICYLLRGINDIIQIASYFNIKKKEITKALKSVEKFGILLVPSITIITPIKVIENLCSKLNIFGDSVEEIKRFCNDRILKYDNSLYEENPNLIGTILLLYYFEVNGIEFSSDELKNYCNKNTVKYVKMKKRISEIFNRN